ncbi:MAG: prolipoprotein diacylglyceryl transferase [Thermales bacterium]|nr:prolipoprotein diacylglyceryl transferase [Thermales bacterium]
MSIRFYSVCLLLAVFCGYFLALYLAKNIILFSTIVDRLLVGMVVFGLIGARLFFVIFNWEAFSGDKLQALFIYQGGLSFLECFWRD